MNASRSAQAPARRDGVPPASPSRDDAGTMTCPVCQTRFAPAGRQRYCSDRCRKTAFRRRHQDPPVPVGVPGARPRREHTIYECPDCDQRYLGDQWCHDCNRPCRRIGPGGPCPHCCEPVAVADLIQEAQR
jgi:hypothetical protein